MATYYLPLWYQATKGVTATKSGLDILPYMLSTVVGAGLSGAIISKVGRYWPFLVCSPLLLSVGAGLLFTVDSSTPNARVIGPSTLYVVSWPCSHGL
jgi:MFS family permease